MKFLPAIGLLSVLALGNAIAADHSVAIVSGGINLYSITEKGVALVKGSPFTIPQTGAYPLTPVLTALNGKDNFVFAVYEDLASPYPPVSLTVVGFAITAKGLIEQWSHSFNVDREIYSNQNAPTLVAGSDYVVFTYTPDDSTPFVAALYNQAGQLVTSLVGPYDVVGPSGLNEPISVHLAPGKHFLYFCHYVGPNNSPSQVVSVYRFDEDALAGTAPHPVTEPTLLLTSTDPAFVESVCN
jgi:hypothetical protein